MPISWLISCLSALSKWQSLIPKLKTGKTHEKDLQKQMTCIQTKIKKSVQPFLLQKSSRANQNSTIKKILEDIAL